MRIAALLSCSLLIPSFCYAGPFTVGAPQSSIVVSTKATAQGNPDVMDSKSGTTGSLSSASEIPFPGQPGFFISWGRSSASQQFTATDSLISLQGDAAAKSFSPNRDPVSTGTANADTTFTLNFSVGSLTDVIFNYDLRGFLNIPNTSLSYSMALALNLTGPGVNQHIATTGFTAQHRVTDSFYLQEYTASVPLSLAPGDYSLSITQDLATRGHILIQDPDGDIGSTISASIQPVPEPSGVLLALIGLAFVGRCLGVARRQR
jgi:hypothetical protein